MQIKENYSKTTRFIHTYIHMHAPTHRLIQYQYSETTHNLTTTNIEINKTVSTKLANCLSLNFHDTQWRFI